MVGSSVRHAAVLSELVEWWQKLSRKQINSWAVLLPIPPGWGRTYVLDKFAKVIKEDEAPCIVVSVEGKSLHEGLGVQALQLRNLFSEARFEPSVAEVLGVDRLGGGIQLSLGVTGLFVTPLAALAGLLIASVVVGGASRVWDNSPAGQEGAVAKLARAVAALSVSVPVVVLIDDADQVEPDLAVVLVENLIGRINGRVLVVAAVNPEGKLRSALTSRARYGLTEGRVATVDADPDMEYPARVELATQRCPDLPAAAVHRIGRRTRTFAEVFEVTSAERLAELDTDGDDAATVAVVDEVVDDKVDRPAPSRLAVVLAWAGGTLHARQAEYAVDVLTEERPGDNGEVVQFESLIRLADPASSLLAVKVRGLATRQRHRLAQIVLDTAMEIGADPRAGQVEKVVAWQAAHRVRGDLEDRARVIGIQCQLVHGLEGLGDPDAAYQVAETALNEYPASRATEQLVAEHDDLLAVKLRLARTSKLAHGDLLTDAAIAAAAAGAAVGLEARIWAAIDLLDQPGQRERALKLTEQITAELNGRNDLGAIGNRWRLQLALHAGRAGHPRIVQRLLGPILAAPSSPEEAAAARALREVGGPKADIRLQVIGLEAELAALPADADDDRLRVHHALAADYGDLGDYRRALYHGQQELALRRRIQGADRRDTLITRANVAGWTGESGHPVEALRLFRELLADQERVLGPDDPDTLAVRNNIALWTGRQGHLAEALGLSRELLPDQERVLGHDHFNTLAVRSNIASWTGQSGRPADALRLSRELLPDQERVLGRDHFHTLTTRHNIAGWTGECEDPAEGLRLLQELLPDKERVLGPDHPDTLSTRGSIALWTARSGHPAEALELSRELLPDQERVHGPDNVHTLTTRGNIAFWTWECEHPAEGLRLYHELLPDQERVLGPDHPDTLSTRNNIAVLTGRGGDARTAVRLFRELLVDQERALGRDHPGTLTIRSNIAFWTAQCGYPADALRLYRELLPDRERVLGPNHPSTLSTRREIQQLSLPGKDG